MFSRLRGAYARLLDWSQKYAKTDMRYVAHGGFWMSLNLVASSVLSLLLAIVFANLLPKEDYGYYKYVLSVGSLFSFSTTRENRKDLIILVTPRVLGDGRAVPES